MVVELETKRSSGDLLLTEKYARGEYDTCWSKNSYSFCEEKKGRVCFKLQTPDGWLEHEKPWLYGTKKLSVDSSKYGCPHVIEVERIPGTDDRVRLRFPNYAPKLDHLGMTPETIPVTLLDDQQSNSFMFQWMIVEDLARPTSEPTTIPTSEPTSEPTTMPTSEPTKMPTSEPTSAPTAEPTSNPTLDPSQPNVGSQLKPPAQNASNTEFSTGAVVGVVLGLCAVLALLSLLVFFVVKRRRRSKNSHAINWRRLHTSLFSNNDVVLNVVEDSEVSSVYSDLEISVDSSSSDSATVVDILLGTAATAAMEERRPIANSDLNLSLGTSSEAVGTDSDSLSDFHQEATLGDAFGRNVWESVLNPLRVESQQHSVLNVTDSDFAEL